VQLDPDASISLPLVDDPDEANTLAVTADVIAVSTGVVVFAILLAVAVWCVRNRRQKRHEQSQQHVTSIVGSSTVPTLQLPGSCYVEMEPIPMPVPVATRVGDPFISVPVRGQAVPTADSASSSAQCCAADDCCGAANAANHASADPTASVHIEIDRSESIKGGGGEEEVSRV